MSNTPTRAVIMSKVHLLHIVKLSSNMASPGSEVRNPGRLPLSYGPATCDYWVLVYRLSKCFSAFGNRVGSHLDRKKKYIYKMLKEFF